MRLTSELEVILVEGTRGDDYDAGRVSERQVCIGDRGLGIEQARFVSPPPGAELDAGLTDWEKVDQLRRGYLRVGEDCSKPIQCLVNMANNGVPPLV